MDKLDLQTITLNKNNLMKEFHNIAEDLKSFAKQPGATRCIAKIKSHSFIIDESTDYLIFTFLKSYIREMNKKDQLNLILKEYHGNVLLISGFEDVPSDKEIKEIPITLGSHLDEITFIISCKKDDEILNSIRIFPIFCSGILTKLYNNDMKRPLKVLGFRNKGEKRVFKPIGNGFLFMKAKKEADENVTEFYIKSGDLNKFRVGDLVIFDDEIEEKTHEDDFIISGKALDDRVGVIAHIYVMRELARLKIKAKAIFISDEEGICSDLAWSRLTNPIFKKFCRREGLIIGCDGFNGERLKELSKIEAGYVKQALIPVYLAEGKGAGDPGFFSIIRDNILPQIQEEKGFEAILTTDYGSRSFDPKIMDDFSTIIFISWSNGVVGDPEAICHFKESVAVEQIINIIGVTFYIYLYFDQCFKEAEIITQLK